MGPRASTFVHIETRRDCKIPGVHWILVVHLRIIIGNSLQQWPLVYGCTIVLCIQPPTVETNWLQYFEQSRGFFSDNFGLSF